MENRVLNTMRQVKKSVFLNRPPLSNRPPESTSIIELTSRVLCKELFAINKFPSSFCNKTSKHCLLRPTFIIAKYAIILTAVFQLNLVCITDQMFFFKHFTLNVKVFSRTASFNERKGHEVLSLT